MPRHFVWLVKANQLYNLEKEQSRIKAKVLFLPAEDRSRLPAGALASAGPTSCARRATYVEFYEIDGTSGHLDGIFSIAKVGDQIKAFLTK